MFNSVKSFGKSGKKRLVSTFKKYPLTTFLASLGVLLLVIMAASFLRRPPVEETEQEERPTLVQTYAIGAAPTIQLQAEVEKTGVITIVAQSGGVVQHINAKPGQAVNKGKNLVSLSTNYQGANIASVQRQISYKQYQQSKETEEADLEVIAKQRELAETQDKNNEELREINEKSIDDTEDQLELNEEILDIINENLEELEAATPSATNDQQILSTKQLKAQYLGALNQLRQQLRQTEYQTDEDEEPARLSELQKEITLKQLDVQEKARKLATEIAWLSYCVSQISESLMYPSAPFSGTVERVYVKKGEVVNPGDPLLAFSGDHQHVSVVATVPADIARNISRYETSTVIYGDQVYQTIPAYVSTEPTEGQLFTVIYELPKSFSNVLSDGSVVTVQAPIGFADTSGAVPSIPIDVIHQLQDSSYVYLVEDGQAVAREITVGAIYGNQVQVSEGLEAGDEVITNRNIIEGDFVETAS